MKMQEVDIRNFRALAAERITLNDYIIQFAANARVGQP
jgi:hypothetical protein